MHCALWIEWDSIEFEEIMASFERCKAKARDDCDERFVEFGGVLFEVSPRGEGSYAFKLVSPDFTLKFNRVRSASDHLTNGFVEIGSAYLMEVGERKAWDTILNCLARGKASLVHHTVSRIDVACDFADLEVERLYEAVFGYGKHHVSTRVKHAVPYYRPDRMWTITGAEFGAPGAPLRLKIYDKTLELLEKPNKRKADAIAARFGGRLPRKVDRFEYQIRRSRLKEFQVTTVEDWIEKQEGIVRNLTQNFVRVVDPGRRNLDRTNIEKIKTHRLWAQVQKAFGEVYDSTLKNVVRCRRKSTSINVDRLASMVHGCLKKIAAGFGCTSKDEAFEVGIREVRRKWNSETAIEVEKQLAESLMANHQPDHDSLSNKVHTEFLEWAPLDWLKRYRKNQAGDLEQQGFVFG